jgi:hypothetical protein
MKQDPADFLAVWQLLLVIAYVLLVVPVAAVVGAAWGRPAVPVARVACGTCTYAMHHQERECPRCRAAR